MGNDDKDTSPEKGSQQLSKTTRLQMVERVKRNPDLAEIKKDVARMEKKDRILLVSDLKAERLKLSQSDNFNVELAQRFTDLEEHLLAAEKGALQQGYEAIGTGINSGIDMLSTGAKKSVNVIGDQAQKGINAVVQIGAQAADVIADPNKSQKEKIVHVAGLAAVVGVPAFLLYKLCKAMSGANLKEGEKPGLGRKILKWTGFAFLGALGVRALAPMVSETQRGFVIQQEEAAKKDAAQAVQKLSPEKQPQIKNFTNASIIERNGLKLLKVGTNNFRVTTKMKIPDFTLFQGNVNVRLPAVNAPLPLQTSVNGGLLINQYMSVDKNEYDRIVKELSGEAKAKSISVQATVLGGRSSNYTLEFTPEDL